MHTRHALSGAYVICGPEGGSQSCAVMIYYDPSTLRLACSEQLE